MTIPARAAGFGCMGVILALWTISCLWLGEIRYRRGADHLGWVLQAQTNALNLGLTTNGWVTLPGTDQVTQTNVSIVEANPSVFFRMTYPKQ